MMELKLKNKVKQLPAMYSKASNPNGLQQSNRNFSTGPMLQYIPSIVIKYSISGYLSYHISGKLAPRKVLDILMTRVYDIA